LAHIGYGDLSVVCEFLLILVETCFPAFEQFVGKQFQHLQGFSCLSLEVGAWFKIQPTILIFHLPLAIFTTTFCQWQVFYIACV
jgi:hypothetical protein